VTRDEYVEMIKSAALTAGKKAVMQKLVAKIPFLSVPLINPIIGYIAGLVLETAIRETEMGLFFLYVDLRLNAQAKDFEAAALKNMKAQMSGSDDEKKIAEKELIDSFRAFVKFSN
jgi:hypothetical protein